MSIQLDDISLTSAFGGMFTIVKVRDKLTAETAAAVTTLLGPGAPPLLEPAARPSLDATHFAIVAADQLVPAWKVVTVDGHHPLDAAPGALAVPLCATDGDRTAVRNIDPEQLTTVAITGVTAMTRLTAELMDRKGVTYPIKDVEPWLAAVDLVHISNEVSFVGKECKPYKSLMTEFCSREGYIQLLEAAHARIIELDGSHLPDYGRSWIDHTLELYRQRGWVWFGGGHDQRLHRRLLRSPLERQEQAAEVPARGGGPGTGAVIPAR
jgi:poly-gamma-glutamate synthesis protein (capsule biosynthesis protein)